MSVELEVFYFFDGINSYFNITNSQNIVTLQTNPYRFNHARTICVHLRDSNGKLRSVDELKIEIRSKLKDLVGLNPTPYYKQKINTILQTKSEKRDFVLESIGV